jgi:hypothetical protein
MYDFKKANFGYATGHFTQVKVAEACHQLY